MEAITKEQAKESDGKKIAEEVFQSSLDEAIEKINRSISIHWELLEAGKMVHTPPISNCYEYKRLNRVLNELYLPNGFNLNWAINAPVITISLSGIITPQNAEGLSDKFRI